MADKKSFYNKNTNATVSVTPQEAITFQGGSTADPYGGLLRSGFVEKIDTPATAGVSALPGASTLPGLTGSTTNPISSTQGVRDAENIVRSDASNINNGLNKMDENTLNYIKDITGFKEPSQAQLDAKAALDKVRSFNELTSADEASIAEAGNVAGADFDKLIAQAQEKKRLGMGEALVGVGQRGGLVSSQFVGRQAAQPLPGELGYVGAGGKLEQIKSAYDLNIENLQIEKQRAIGAARALAKQTIRTGRKEDYDLLEKIYERAKIADDEANKLQQEKLDAIIKVQTIQEKQASAASKGLIEVSPGASMYDINTGKFIGTAPQKPADNKPIIEKRADGSLIQWEPTTNTWKEIASGESPSSAIKKEWLDYLSTSGIDINKKTDAEIQSEATKKGLLGFNAYMTMDANRKRTINTTTIVNPEQYDKTLKSLTDTVGVDGYVNTDEYKKQRNLVKDKTTFDDNYSYLLNPNDKTATPFISIKKTELTADQQGIIGDAKAAIDQVKQRYGDWNATRSQIIERAKQQYNFDLSPYL